MLRCDILWLQFNRLHFINVIWTEIWKNIDKMLYPVIGDIFWVAYCVKTWHSAVVPDVVAVLLPGGGALRGLMS